MTHNDYFGTNLLSKNYTSIKKGLERAKFWTGNNVVGKNLGQWRGNWASGFPQKHRNSAPVYMVSVTFKH